MNLLTAGFLAGLAVLGLTLNVHAAAPSKATTWTLSTADTELTVTVANGTINLIRLCHPGQKWNWISAPAPVPMPGVQVGDQSKPLHWEFRDATEDLTHGHQVTLRFTCTDPPWS